MRQTTNRMGNLKSYGESEITVKYGNQTALIKMADVVPRVGQIFELFGLKYEKPTPEQRNHWWGTAAPMLSYSSTFEHRLTKLRIGHSSMTIRKADGVKTGIPVSDFGLSPIHHVLLEGLSFPPTIKSSMAHSLGPATQILQLIKQGGTATYGKKWKDAVLRTFAHVKGIEEIVEALAGRNVPIFCAV